MDGSYLHETWSAPDNTRLVSKQFSLRLPVHVVAQLSAIGEMYPTKTRTQIVADLLTFALQDYEKKLPTVMGNFSEFTQDIDDGKDYYQIDGLRRLYWELSNKYFSELERDLGNSNPKPLFNVNVVAPKDSFEK